MITTSERVLSITIWVLTASGSFFGGRAVWRRRRQKREAELKPDPLLKTRLSGRE